MHRLLILTIVLFVPALAQQYPFVPITGPNAPRGASILLESRWGGLWLGSDDGLTFFDGSRFVVPFKGSFPRAQTLGLAEDKDGGLWIASTGGLWRLFKGQLTEIVDYAGFEGIAEVAPGVLLATMIKKGNDYFTLVRITGVHGAWRAETIADRFPQARFQPSRDGTVFFPCSGGFCEFSGDEVAHWVPGKPPNIAHHAFGNSTGVDHTTSVYRDRVGCVWMRGSFDARYQCPGDKQPTTLPARVAGRGPSGISELTDGSVVIASFGEIAIGRPGKFRVITAFNGYPGAGYWLLAKDGSIWLSSGTGLFVFPSRLPMEFWSEREGLGGNTWSVLPLNTKTFAIAGEEIRVLDRDRARWQSLRELRGATHLSSGPGGTIFASTQTDGVVQMNQEGRILRKSDPVSAMMLAQTPDGQFWMSGGEIATFTQNGARLNVKPEGIPGIQENGIDLKVDREGGLWTCTDAGLVHKDKLGWHVISATNGLLQNVCRSFAIDQNENIWYGYSNPALGFSLIQNPSASHPTIRHFSSGGEIGTTVNRFFASDHRGWLWRGSQDGVYVTDVEQANKGHWLYLSRSDGLPGADTNQRSFIEDRDGSVWFGIDNSVVHLFPPDDLVRPQYAPPVFVSGLSWNNSGFQMADTVDSIEHGADVVAHVGSLQFDRRNALRLRYRLLPGQTAWEAERNLDIRLGKLPWGTHRLEVQARLGTGPWSAVAEKSFTVLKPAWLSWPSLLGFFTVGSFAAVASYLWWKARLERKSMLLPEIGDLRLAALSPELRSFEGSLLDERFEVLGVLAFGSFGTVFKGRDLRQDRPCAVKIFRQELLEKSWMSKRFQQEVSALTQICHRNVVDIYGHGTAPSGAPYLVMEFIEGKTLRDLLEDTKIDRRRSAVYLRQAADALTEIHAHGICHRDVKPENLMIRNAAPPGEELVLIDFSIAIVQDPDETMHGLSRAAGTLYYMAPEQAIGYADASSDIHSLAKTLIEMLTGERLSSLLPDASMDLPVRVRELLAGLPLGLSADSINLIAAALEFDPARRPKIASVFAARICHDLDNGVTPS